MFLLLFCLWLVFNGQVTLEIVIIGLGISAVLYFFCCRFMGFSIKKDKTIVRELPLIFVYIANLILEVIKATFATTKFIFQKEQPSPAIVKFHSGLKSNTARVLLANSITLTPGTITVDLTDDLYTIHCLDKSMGDGIEACSFVKQLQKMEEVAGL